MQGLRYIEDVVTLKLDAEKCTGCRTCTLVCPHGVFEMRDGRAHIRDLGACMECGACAKNCAWGAITVDPGVGCAEAIIRSWIFGGEPTCGCATPSQPGACCGPEQPAESDPCGCASPSDTAAPPSAC